MNWSWRGGEDSDTKPPVPPCKIEFCCIDNDDEEDEDELDEDEEDDDVVGVLATVVGVLFRL